MKPLVVQDQVKIGAMRCLALSVEGMSYRMFRSLVTVSILGLAVTFLIHMVAYGIIAHNTKLLAYHRLQDSRLLGEWMARLALPDQEQAVLQVLRNPALFSGGKLEEYRQWSRVSTQDFERAGKIAQMAGDAWSYFEGLPVATRVALTGGLDATDSTGLLGELGDRRQYEFFIEHLKQLGLRPPLGNIGLFETLVHHDAPQLAIVVRGIRDGQARAIVEIQARYPGRDARSLFADPPPGLGTTLAAAGFRIPRETLDRISVQAKAASDIEWTARSLDDAAFKNVIARKLNLQVANTDVQALMNWLDSQDHAAWLAGELSKTSGSNAPDADRILFLANSARLQTSLQKVAGDEIPTASTGILSLPSQTLWLIAVSFLVCVVGVANAMLMSVTERFTEIATMKCLGALNGFVTQVFFFEALLQGIVGGFAGILAGVTLAVLRCLWEFGSLSMTALPVGEIIGGSLLAWAIGVALAGAAAIGPVAVAARLAPMEAMRVE